jgi:hypothetical protein
MVKTPQGNLSAETDSRDISFKGLFVSTERKIPRDTPCEIEILLSGSSNRPSIKARGTIARQEKSGLGIRFDSIEADSYVHLHHLLLYNSTDPDAMEQEIHPFAPQKDIQDDFN